MNASKHCVLPLGVKILFIWICQHRAQQNVMDSLASPIVWKHISELQKITEKERKRDVTMFGIGDIQYWSGQGISQTQVDLMNHCCALIAYFWGLFVPGYLRTQHPAHDKLYSFFCEGPALVLPSSSVAP